MPATRKVSLTRQTIYALIPFLDLYAAYHIKKLRWYLLITIAVGLAMSTITSVVGPKAEDYDPNKMVTIDGQVDWGYIFWGENPGIVIGTMIVNNAISLAVSVYIIRRWSKQWNKQFEYSDL